MFSLPLVARARVSAPVRTDPKKKKTYLSGQAEATGFNAKSIMEEGSVGKEQAMLR
jgi:hypothetical protein